MNVQLTESLKKNNQEQLSEAIREMIKQNIKYQADFVVTHSMHPTINEGFLDRLIVGLDRNNALGMVISSFVATSMIATSAGIGDGTALSIAAFSSIVGMGFSSLTPSNSVDRNVDNIVRHAEQRDRVAERALSSKTLLGRDIEIQKTSKEIQKYTDFISKAATEIIKEHGEDLSAAQRSALKSAQRGLVSDFLSDKNKLQKIVRRFDESLAESFDVMLQEGIDLDTLARYIGSFARNVGIAAAGVLFTVAMVFSGGIPAAIAVAVSGGVVSAVASTFYAYHRALNVDKVRMSLMNTQAGRKFDKLVEVIEKRDALLKEIGQYKKFKDREKASKRIAKPMQKLTDKMKEISSSIRADLAEIGDDWSMNEYDKENLMKMLEHGERGVVSGVLSERKEVEKLKFEEQPAVA